MGGAWMRPDIERRIRQLQGRSIEEMASLIGYDVTTHPFGSGQIEMMVLPAPHKLIILDPAIYNNPRRREWAIAHMLAHALTDHRYMPRDPGGKLSPKMLQQLAEVDEVARLLLQVRAREFP